MAKTRVMGCDIGEHGMDYTVCVIIDVHKGNYEVTHIESWSKTDTMTTVGRIGKLVKEHKVKKVNVDAIGVGSGVFARLEELNYKVHGIKVGESPDKEKHRFLNKKSEMYWNLRTLFEEGRISIPKHQKLLSELSKMKYELTSSGKIKIVDPSNKSPDFADGLALGCFKPKKDFAMVELEMG